VAFINARARQIARERNRRERDEKQRAKILAACGATTPAEALAKLAAWSERQREIRAAWTNVEAARAREERVRRFGVVVERGDELAIRRRGDVPEGARVIERLEELDAAIARARRGRIVGRSGVSARVDRRVFRALAIACMEAA
jgi:hypothetical protein